MARHFNFRVLTRLLKPDESIMFKNDRLFGIYEVHYEDDKVDSYSESPLIHNWDTLADLKFTYDKLAYAFQRPILDIDNWPNEWIGEDSPITGKDVAALLHGIHKHTKFTYNKGSKQEVVYREEDLLPILEALGLPKVDWGESTSLTEWLNKRRK